MSDAPTWDNGKIEGESNAHYHACPAVSHSKLKVFRRSKQLYYRRFVSRTVPSPEPTAAMALGTAAHVLICEGEKAYAQAIAIKPDDINRRTKKGKVDYAKFEREAGDRLIISIDQAALVRRMAEAVNAHPAAAALMAGCSPEITWRAMVGGLRVQCRSDLFGANQVEVPGRGSVGLRVVDLKTVESVSDGDMGCFQKQFFELGYYRQAGFYLALLHSILPPDQIPADGIPFFFIAVEKQEPHGVLVVEPDAEALALGFEESIADLKELRACVESGVWPSTPDEVVKMSLPSWFVKKSQSKL